MSSATAADREDQHMDTVSANDYLLHVLQMSREKTNIASGFRGVYLEVAKLEIARRGLQSEKPDMARIQAALNRIRDRDDMADFVIPALIRILKEYRSILDASVINGIEETLVGFRYWLDEPGEINACYFTENHQVLYHSAEILVGELFPDRVFPSDGHTGSWHRQHGITFLNRWMDWRERFGFSEWFSNYYTEDILALLVLYYYAENETIRIRSKALIDTLLLDIAVNTFEGNWAGCQGRTYVPFLVEPAFESISPICRMYWGEGSIDGGLSDCAIMLAVFEYQCPKAIAAIGRDKPAVMINRERMSLDVKEASEYGVDPSDFDNIMFFWGQQTYDAREVIQNSARVMTPSNWMNERINAYLEKYMLCDTANIPADDDPDFTALTQVNLYTYKTPDYILSCAQDYRKGKPGYQQQIWGAFLGGRARVFTNHMGSYEYRDRPNFLAGNSYMPRACQYENVIICIYRIPADHTRCLETHAFFPKQEFDEVIEQNGWVFGRRKNAYIALKSMNPAHWKSPDINLFKEVYQNSTLAEERFRQAKPMIYHADGHANVWVAEMGSKAQNGSFEAFVNCIAKAVVEGNSIACSYNSPSQGRISFGWTQPLIVNGREIRIQGYKRYDNPYCQAEFNTMELTVRCGSEVYRI
jgi:hypothetical protein